MNPVEKLIKELSRLPGIGEKSAGRIAYFLLRTKEESAKNLAHAIVDLKKQMRFCSSCLNITDTDPCSICSDPNRDKKSLCVVEEPQDASAIEKTHSFRGLYHVLHGAISPLEGIGPDDIKTAELIKRLKSGQISEMIIATNPTVEGEATSIYISKIAKSFNIKTSRIALGIPFGGDIEYIDRSTLSRAMESRSEIK